MKTFLTWTPVVVSVLILGLLTWQYVENKSKDADKDALDPDAAVTK